MKIVTLVAHTNTMSTTNLITIICYLITAVVTILCVFATYFLGQRKYYNSIQTEDKTTRYKKLYLPLIRSFYYEADEHGIFLPSFYNHQRKELYRNGYKNKEGHDRLKFVPYSDKTLNFIMNNMQYASPELLSKCLDYSKVIGSVYLAANYKLFNPDVSDSSDTPEVKATMDKINHDIEKKYQKETLEAIARFMPMVKQVVLEAKQLSKDLKSEDLTTPLSKSLITGQENSDLLIKALKESSEFEISLKQVLRPFG